LENLLEIKNISGGSIHHYGLYTEVHLGSGFQQGNRHRRYTSAIPNELL